MRCTEHRWVDVTAMGDRCYRYVCERCPAEKVGEPVDRRRDIMRKLFAVIVLVLSISACVEVSEQEAQLKGLVEPGGTVTYLGRLGHYETFAVCRTDRDMQIVQYPNGDVSPNPSIAGNFVVRGLRCSLSPTINE